MALLLGTQAKDFYAVLGHPLRMPFLKPFLRTIDYIPRKTVDCFTRNEKTKTTTERPCGESCLVLVVLGYPHGGVHGLLAEGALGAVGKPGIDAVLVEGVKAVEHLIHRVS